MAAKEEAQCIAEMEVLKQRLKHLDQRKKEYEIVAQAAQKACSQTTHLAAKDAAQVDAELKAIDVVHESAEDASSKAKRAEWELKEAERMKAELVSKSSASPTVPRMNLKDFAKS